MIRSYVPVLGRKTHFGCGVHRRVAGAVVVTRGAVRTGAVVVGSGGATVVVGTGAALVEGVPLAVAEVDGAVVDGVLLLGTTSVDGIEPDGATTGRGSVDGPLHMLTVTAIAATQSAVAAAMASTRPVKPPMRAELEEFTRWVIPRTRSGRSRARRTLSQSCPSSSQSALLFGRTGTTTSVIGAQ